MGAYLNSKNPYGLFLDEAASAYFIDKSEMLSELMPLAEQTSDPGLLQDPDSEKGNKYICITRPRRFGKTLMACMIASFFGKGADSSALFRQLRISKTDGFETHINQHNVIFISFNEIPQNCASYQDYIRRIQSRLQNDLLRAFPDAGISSEEAVWDMLSELYELYDARFIFVLDEWDYIFHRNFVTDADKMSYIDFLSNLLKGKSYVEFAYMTGILPIASHTTHGTLESKDSIVDASDESLQAVFPADASYSSGSELNMFFEYTMAAREKYSTYFGFTDEEVDLLYARYLNRTAEPRVTREDLRLWYDGYQTVSGTRLYNPRSVVGALTDNQPGSYWTSSGPYDEIFYYIEHNVAQVRDDLALMISGIPVRAKVQEYAATSTSLTTRDEIFSAMVVYGFLSCEKGQVSIPNKELMDKFADMLQKEPSLGYVYQLAHESERMLQATKDCNTATMCRILEHAHNTETPLLSYNNETELTAIVNLVYLAARDSYRIEREDKAGTGFVDFIFYPLNNQDDCIILELKVNHTPEEALHQIKNRKYALRFEGKLGETPRYTGRILAVGISYYKDDSRKRHSCKVEVLRGRIR